MNQTQNHKQGNRQTPTPLRHVVCNDCINDAPVFGLVALCGARPTGPLHEVSEAECVVCVDLYSADAECPRCGR